MKLERPIYLDNNATTQTDPEVLESMLPYFTTHLGNASSIDHAYGAEANEAVEKARSQISDLINCEASEIIFTSGATEADNLAIIGLLTQLGTAGKHMITSNVEHKAVLQPAEYLKTLGVRLSVLPVDQEGIVDPADLESAIEQDTVLVTIMTANNEVGSIQPIRELVKIAHEAGAFFHTDAAQAVGHIRVDMKESDVDMLSVSAHKMYGPKGVGALVIRKRRPRIRIRPLILGGGHEKGLRSGTLNVPGIVGFGEATRIAHNVYHEEEKRLVSWRDFMLDYMKDTIDDVYLNGHPRLRLPHNLNISITGVQNKALQYSLKREIAFSTGSACGTNKVEASHVLTAMGHSSERISSSIRIGLGRFTTRDEVDYAAKRLTEESERLRKLAA